MPTPADPGSFWRRWRLVAGVCLLVGTAKGIGMLVRPLVGSTSPVEIASHWVHWSAWAAFFPVFYVLVRRFSLEPGRRLTSVAAYIVLGPPIFLAHGALHRLFIGLFDPSVFASFRAFATEVARLDAGYPVLGYSFLLAVAWALEYHQRATDSARLAAELEAQLARAELGALKMQIHPHFLFNTLNSISALLHRDPAAADRMIARLGDFLRLTLQNQAAAEVPLEDEMRFVTGYLSIQEVRFRDRLTTRIALEPGVERALVPNLILQPLVENAIRHGVSRLTGAGEIVIRAGRSNGHVRLEVQDNGPGRQPAAADHVPGLGLVNTAARLRALYGDHQSLEAVGGPGEGFRVTIEMPYRPAEPPSPCVS